MCKVGWFASLCRQGVALDPGLFEKRNARLSLMPCSSSLRDLDLKRVYGLSDTVHQMHLYCNNRLRFHLLVEVMLVVCSLPGSERFWLMPEKVYHYLIEEARGAAWQGQNSWFPPCHALLNEASLPFPPDTGCPPGHQPEWQSFRPLGIGSRVRMRGTGE